MRHITIEHVPRYLYHQGLRCASLIVSDSQILLSTLPPPECQAKARAAAIQKLLADGVVGRPRNDADCTEVTTMPASERNDHYLGSPSGLQDNEAFAARVHGDSMNPKYHEGDIIIFSAVLPVRSGDDCFVTFADGRTTFKRVFFEGGSIRLQPRNAVYCPQTVSREQVRAMNRAVYRCAKCDVDDDMPEPPPPPAPRRTRDPWNR